MSPWYLFIYWMAPDQNPGVWRHGGVRQVQQRTIRASSFKVNTLDVISTASAKSGELINMLNIQVVGFLRIFLYLEVSFCLIV